MDSYALAHVTDEELLADLGALVATDRRTTAALLAHLAEVDARKLFLPAACASMHVYCVRVLRLADEVAFKRIRAARAARRHPQIFDAIADGRLNVTGVVLLAPHVTDANVDEVLAAAAHRSKAELEMLVARLAPRPDVPASIAPIARQASGAAVLQLDPDPAPTSPSPLPARVRAIAPERFALQCTISSETRAKLERLQALMSHSNPSGDLGEIIDRACDALIAVVERERFAVTSRPRAKGARPESEADRKLGADFMAAKRAEAKAKQPAAATSLESDLIEALTSLGYKPAEAQRAVADTADSTATTFEARLRATLASLSRSRPIRCSDGPFEMSAGLPLWIALRDWSPGRGLSERRDAHHLCR